MDRTENTVGPEPGDWRWTELTDELLSSLAGDHWLDLAEKFVPVDKKAAREMAEWFCTGVRNRKMPAATYAVHTDNELLGFFAVERAEIEFSRRARPILEVRRLSIRLHRLKRGPQPGLLLSSIARAESTVPGFGRVLFEHAVGVAHDDSQENVALFVLPANRDVSRMWKDIYNFRPMDEPREGISEVLWFPTDPTPEGEWP